MECAYVRRAREAKREVNCETCNKVFYITPSRYRKNKHHTCSLVCSGKLSSKLHSKKIVTNCKACNKEIYYKKSHFKQILNPTCSTECSAKIRSVMIKGSNNPNAKNLNKLEKYFYNRCRTLKDRAKVRNMEFDLDYKFLMELYDKQKGKCYYSGLELNINKSSEVEYNTMSVDRMNTKKGYTKNNIVLCLNSINMFKAHHDLDNIKKVFKAIMLKEQDNINVNIKKLYPDAKLPYKKSIFDAGSDLYVHRFEDCGQYIKIYTGIAIEPDQSYYFFLANRSSTFKKGLMLYNNLGIIDQNYRGEIIATMYKTDDYEGIKVGDRLVQLVPQRQINTTFIEVNELSETDRNEKGFGSSGQ
jgi:dUTP pyrophosphatase